MGAPHYTDVGLEHLCLGLMSIGKITDDAMQSFVNLIQTVVGAGGTVVVPANATSMVSHVYLKRGVRRSKSHAYVGLRSKRY